MEDFNQELKRVLELKPEKDLLRQHKQNLKISAELKRKMLVEVGSDKTCSLISLPKRV